MSIEKRVCTLATTFGGIFAVANLAQIVLGFGSEKSMMVLMELCFLSIFAALACMGRNQGKIIRNQKTIISKVK